MMQFAEKFKSGFADAGLRTQKLPSAGAQREVLRSHGQFWTPGWLAEVMAAWVTENDPPTIFDPAVGPGTFFAAAKNEGYRGGFTGFELHADVLNGGHEFGLDKLDLRQVKIADFLLASCSDRHSAIISNPPYIRHHRLGEFYKHHLQDIAREYLGFPIDGRAGVQLYFLVKCLSLLNSGGRLAFLLPADVCEGVSSRRVWKKICEQFCLEAVLTFAESAAPFPQVDTNAMVFMISRRPPTQAFKWIRVIQKDKSAILRNLNGDYFDQDEGGSVQITHRKLTEGLDAGFSRPPQVATQTGQPLAKFARVMRGIATGANEFFFLTHEQIDFLRLDKRMFCRAVGRTRDCESSTLMPDDLQRLDAHGRPTWLLNLKGVVEEKHSVPLAKYLAEGEKAGFAVRALIKSRNPWYKMEQRTPPPLLFAYLGRRVCRFILNKAGAVPLTGFLCVYPQDTSKASIHKLWQALNHPSTLKNLPYVGKSYGKGAIKVEPRQLELLEIPQKIIDEFGLSISPKLIQPLLLDKAGRFRKSVRRKNRRSAASVSKQKF